jgi:hypothetical protein
MSRTFALTHREVSLLPRTETGLAISLCVASAKLALELAGITRYGPFRDELYYLACGQHLAWGYIDQPPLIAAVARLTRDLFGDSLPAMRLVPVLAGAFLVFLTGLLAREMGGGRFAQFLAAAAVLFAPAIQAFDSFLSMNAFEPVFWMLCAYLVIRMIKGAGTRSWVLVGLVSGVGLLNKHTMLIYGFAIVVGLLLTPERRLLKNPWLWLGGLIALAIFLPNLLWEAHHNWPQIEVVRNGREFKIASIGAMRFLFEQFLFLQPVAFPIWVGGLGWLLFSRAGKGFRSLGWAYLVVMAIFMGLHGKTYYPLPAYPVLMAAGGMAFEHLLQASRWAWLRWSYAALLVLAGVATIPYGVPILPVEAFVRYDGAVGLAHTVKTERERLGPLPQLYADMVGWRDMTATVARVYHSLPVDEQQSCAILAGNYGEAGAIDYYGREFGLPKSISPHNNYFLWGPGSYTGECVVLFGDRAEEIKTNFAEVQPSATIVRPYSMPLENNLLVYICRRPRIPLALLWPSLKYYI